MRLIRECLLAEIYLCLSISPFCLLFCYFVVALSHQMNEVNDELLKKIANSKNQAPSRPFKVERTPSSPVPLNFDSTAEQVSIWLGSKGFSKP